MSEAATGSSDLSRWTVFAGVAQLVEQRIRNAKVGSSTLLTGTKIVKRAT